MSTESLRNDRNRLTEVIDRLGHRHERVDRHGNGRTAAVVTSAEDRSQLQEAIHALSDPEAVAGTSGADQAYAEGHAVRASAPDPERPLPTVPSRRLPEEPEHEPGGADRLGGRPDDRSGQHHR